MIRLGILGELFDTTQCGSEVRLECFINLNRYTCLLIRGLGALQSLQVVPNIEPLVFPDAIDSNPVPPLSL